MVKLFGWKRKRKLKKRMSEIKYYSLDELKVGMRVSVVSLDKIVGVKVFLDMDTFEYDIDQIGFGNILYIGNDEEVYSMFDPSRLFVIHNFYDLTREDIFEE